MPVKPVAVDGDVTPTTGTLAHSSMPTPAWTPGPAPPAGAEPPPEPPAPGLGWAAGPVVHTRFDKLTVAGTPVVYKAECTFTYTATNNASGLPSMATSKVTLNAGPQPLLGGATKVLVDQDTAQDEYGNRLTAHASAKLRTG